MMTFNKEHWLTLLLSAFFFLLPWQTRWIYDVLPLQGGVSEYGIMSLYGTEILLMIGLLVGYSVMGAPKFRENNRRPAQLVLLLLGAVLIMSAFSLEPTLSFAAYVHLGSALLVFLALLDERTELKRVMMAFVLGLIIPVFLGLFQVFTGGSPASTIFGLASREAERLGDAVIVLDDGTRVLRAYGSFPHPNMFGGYLAVAVVAVLAFLSETPKTNVFDRKRVALALLLIVVFGGLLLTASRSAILGLALGLALSILVTRAKSVAFARLAVIPIAIVVIGGAVLLSAFSPKLLSSVRGGGELEERSLAERNEQYAEYLGVMDASDWVKGNGLGTYTFALAEAYPSREVWEYQPIHNVILLIIAEIGLLGAALALLWTSTIDRMNFARFPDHDAVTAFAMGNVILVILFFDHYLWSSWSGLVLIAFVMALTVRMGESNR